MEVSLLGARARVVKDLDGQESGGLSDTVGGATDGTSDVSAVALDIVVVVVGEVASEGSAAIELLKESC